MSEEFKDIKIWILLFSN